MTFVFLKLASKTSLPAMFSQTEPRTIHREQIPSVLFEMMDQDGHDRGAKRVVEIRQ